MHVDFDMGSEVLTSHPLHCTHVFFPKRPSPHLQIPSFNYPSWLLFPSPFLSLPFSYPFFFSPSCPYRFSSYSFFLLFSFLFPPFFLSILLSSPLLSLAPFFLLLLPSLLPLTSSFPSSSYFFLPFFHLVLPPSSLSLLSFFLHSFFSLFLPFYLKNERNPDVVMWTKPNAIKLKG